MVNITVNSAQKNSSDNCIASWGNVIIIYDTDIAVPIAASSYTFRIKVAPYIDPSLAPEPTSAPSVDCWATTLNTGSGISAFGTDFPAYIQGLSNGYNKKQFAVKCTAFNNGGFLRMRWTFDYVEQLDREGYWDSSVISNHDKLLKDRRNNPMELTNDGVTVYTAADRVFRLALWVQDPIGDTTRILHDITTAQRFYNETDGDILIPTFRIERCGGVEADTISNQDSPQTLFFFCQIPTPLTGPLLSHMWAIRTDRYNDGTDYANNYELEFKDTATVSNLLPTINHFPFVPASAKFIAVGNTAFTNIYDDKWECSIGLDSPQFLDGDKYRFICLILDGATYKFYSFISDEYEVSNCGCKSKPTIIVNGIANYFGWIGDYAQTTPFEPLNHRIKIDATAYNAVNITPLKNAIKTVRVQMFAFPDSTSDATKLFYYDFLIYRDPINPANFIAPYAPPSITWQVVKDDNLLFFQLQHRVRWEQDIPAQYLSVNGVPQATSAPISMEGGTVHCWFTFNTEQVNGVKEEWIFKHRLKVFPQMDITQLPLQYMDDSEVSVWCAENVKQCYENTYCRSTNAFAALQLAPYDNTTDHYLEDNLGWGLSSWMQYSDQNSIWLDPISSPTFNVPIGENLCVSINPVSPFPDIVPSLELDTNYKIAIVSNNLGVMCFDISAGAVLAQSEPTAYGDCMSIDPSFIDNFSCGNAFTISLWTNYSLPNIGGNVVFFALNSMGTLDIYFTFVYEFASGKFVLTTQNGASTDIAKVYWDTGGAPVSTVWHNIVLTHDGGADITTSSNLYINNTLYPVEVGTEIHNPSNDDCINGWLGDPFLWTMQALFYPSAADYVTVHNLQISNGILSTTQIAEIVQRGPFNNPWSYEDEGVILQDMLSPRGCNINHFYCDDNQHKPLDFYRDGVMYLNYWENVGDLDNADINCGECAFMQTFTPYEYY